MEVRAQNPKILAKSFTRSAIQDILGREIYPNTTQEVSYVPRRDSGGRIAVVGGCYIRKQEDQKSIKTRKARTSCLKAVCNKHSTNRLICDICLLKSQ